MKSDPINVALEQILKEVSACLRQVSIEELAQAVDLVNSSPRIFVAGVGRSGLCMRAFGMRLMHLGKTAYVVGETTTPSLGAEDLLIIGSGSGRTAGLLTMAGQARNRGAKILLFTTNASSPLAELADQKVIIPAPSFRMAEGVRSFVSIQPLGTLFEQSLLILCDWFILRLMQQTGTGAAQMFERHANLE
jgi:6-phospho-3-hexuloisomerase